MKWIKCLFGGKKTTDMHDQLFLIEIEYELESLDRLSKSDNGSNFNAGMKYAYSNTLKLFEKYHKICGG